MHLQLITVTYMNVPRRSPGPSLWLALFLIAAVVGCEGCGNPSTEPPVRYSSVSGRSAQSTQAASPGLVMGEFALAKNAIKDGDTISVQGLDASLRLLGIDTEETFKKNADRLASSRNFKKYLQDNRGDSRTPRKAATPMGMEAKAFAKEFFRDVKTVRIERDDPKEIRGRFNRYLAYVFAKKNGQWINYNVECVRAGMSPYFMKYGYSQRFHPEFVQAEREARAAKIGIWDSRTQNYGDYDERNAWWTARADFIAAFDKEAQNRPDYISLDHWDSLARIKERFGQQVTLLSTVGEVHKLSPNLTRVTLSRRQFDDFPIIFFSNDVLKASGIRGHGGEYVTVTGIVATYERGSRKEYQVEVRRPSQVRLSELPF